MGPVYGSKGPCSMRAASCDCSPVYTSTIPHTLAHMRTTRTQSVSLTHAHTSAHTYLTHTHTHSQCAGLCLDELLLEQDDVHAPEHERTQQERAAIHQHKAQQVLRDGLGQHKILAQHASHRAEERKHKGAGRQQDLEPNQFVAAVVQLYVDEVLRVVDVLPQPLKALQRAVHQHEVTLEKVLHVQQLVVFVTLEGAYVLIGADVAPQVEC
mmetsp:Transcript_32946/g.72809  ORF Transcript_32946/g.72809 Transcript_32946/m.72809 type:complete len:211 (-) Transcript_32946:1298-1930(-)